MSKKDDTFEMLDDTPETSKKSIVLLLLLLLLMIGGIPTYLQKQSANPVKTVAPVSEPIEKAPASTPTAAAQPSPPISSVVNFDEASAIIKPDQLAKLQVFYQQIKDSAGTVQINGYTDNLGSSKDGLTLSKQRAEAAATALKSWGTGDNIQLIVESFGENSPVGDNSTALGRQQNRRVELKFIPAP